MTTADQQFQGVYGTYAITDTDRRECGTIAWLCC